MTGSQEEELRAQNDELRASIAEQDAANQPLIDLQRSNALAQEGSIAKFNAGEGEVLPGTLRDFDVAEEELEEKFRRSGTLGSSAHIKATNDFQTKKSESLAAIREGRLTNLQQNSTAQSDRLQQSLSNRGSNASTILSSLSSNINQSGFSRRNLSNQFFQGVGGSLLQKGTGSNIFSGAKAGGNFLGSLFGRKKTRNGITTHTQPFKDTVQQGSAGNIFGI